MKIYALASTIDGHVFYIGATMQRLEVRLCMHTKTITGKKKWEHMKAIWENGGLIEMFELDECDFLQASFWEQFYIDLFHSLGFTLLQRRKSTYSESKFENRRRKYVQSPVINQ